MAKSVSKDHSPSQPPVGARYVALAVSGGVITCGVLAAVLWAPMPRAKMVETLVLAITGLATIWMKRSRH